MPRGIFRKASIFPFPIAYVLTGVRGMDKEQNMQLAAQRTHTLSMENRQKAALTGVSEVLAFDENQVILMTDSGEIALTGEGLHVTRLMLEEGQLTVEGKLDSIFYTQRSSRRSFFRRGGK